MKKMTMLAALTAMTVWQPKAAMTVWQPKAVNSYMGYSYPVSSNRHTGKAAERRAAKRRRKAK